MNNSNNFTLLFFVFFIHTCVGMENPEKQEEKIDKYYQLVSADGHELIVSEKVTDQSPVLKAMFSGNFKEKQSNTVKLNLDNATLEPFLGLLHFKVLAQQKKFNEKKTIKNLIQNMQSIKNFDEEVINVLDATDFYQVPVIETACISHLASLMQNGAKVPEIPIENKLGKVISGLQALYQNKKLKENYEIINEAVPYADYLPQNSLSSKIPFFKSKKIKTLKGHKNYISCLTVDPKTNHLVSGSGDTTIKVWDMDSGNSIKTLEGHKDWINCLTFDPKTNHLVSGSGDTTIKVWDMESGKSIKTLKGHTSWINCLTVDPKTNHLVSGSRDTTIKVWDMDSGNSIKTLEGHKDWINCLTFDPKTNHLVSGSRDTTIKVWDMESGKSIKTLEGHTSWISCLTVDPKTNHLVSGSGDTTIKVWDMESGKSIKTLEGHKNWINCLTVDPKTNHLVSGSRDTTIKVWDMDSGNSIKTLKGHKNWISCLTVDPKTNHLVSGSGDTTIKVWDMDSGNSIKTLEGHKDCISCLTFDPKTNHLVSGSWDTTIKVWQLDWNPKQHIILALLQQMKKDHDNLEGIESLDKEKLDFFKDVFTDEQKTSIIKHFNQKTIEN